MTRKGARSVERPKGVTTRTIKNITGGYENMSLLSETQIDFIDDQPLRINPVRVGRISAKMSKQKTTETPAVYSKSQGEHRKDIVIAILVSGIITFVGGMVFQSKQQQAIETAVKGAQIVAPAETPKK